MEEDKKRYTVEIDEKLHFITTRLEIALRRITKEENLGGFGINFMGFKGKKGAEVIPFAAISKFLSEGYGYAGEGDVLCAISV